MENEEEIKQWKMKKLIQFLEKARGSGSSVITLLLPPYEQVPKVSAMLHQEYGTASNIKSRVNKLGVLSAITSCLQILKLYKNVPKNGLVLYCGTIVGEDGKEKKYHLDFEPYKPLNTFLYLCDDKFHTEPLKYLLKSNDIFGFIIIDGSGCLFATLAGDHKEILYRFTVELPKKHNKGGQSSVRFARLRVEARHNYVRKCAELATQMFISENKANVKGLIVGGLADFKTVLIESDLFDPRLKKIVLKTVDVSYGGENGLAQTIELSSDALQDVKFIRERKLLSKFFDHIAQNSGKYCFGIRDTYACLAMGAVETIIVWENADYKKINIKDKKEPILLEGNAIIHEKVALDEIESVESFQEWIMEHRKEFGATLELVSDYSQEGSQFVKGFGGIGALLRYQVHLDHLDEEEEKKEENGKEEYDPLLDYF